MGGDYVHREKAYNVCKVPKYLRPQGICQAASYKAERKAVSKERGQLASMKSKDMHLQFDLSQCLNILENAR